MTTYNIKATCVTVFEKTVTAENEKQARSMAFTDASQSWEEIGEPDWRIDEVTELSYVLQTRVGNEVNFFSGLGWEEATDLGRAWQLDHNDNPNWAVFAGPVEVTYSSTNGGQHAD